MLQGPATRHETFASVLSVVQVRMASLAGSLMVAPMPFQALVIWTLLKFASPEVSSVDLRNVELLPYPKVNSPPVPHQTRPRRLIPL